jgi:hypothetical protein
MKTPSEIRNAIPNSIKLQAWLNAKQGSNYFGLVANSDLILKYFRQVLNSAFQHVFVIDVESPWHCLYLNSNRATSNQISIF